MKKILYLIMALVVLCMASCQKPEHVAATADRQGFSSLTATFSFGPNMGKTAGRLDITDESASRFVIPISYYYPEDSDDETTPFMTKMRVQAGLEPGCSLEPGLTYLDLTKDNHFTYTNAKGESRDIVITGNRVHSSACELLAFSITEPDAIAGIVDKARKTVSLISAADLYAATAEAQVSAHATISPDPAQPHDYNSPVTFTVTAADGVTSCDYVVAKSEPEKIGYGFKASSVEYMFNVDPSTHFGAPSWTGTVWLSMGVVGRYLVVSYGDGAPIYLNKLTGVRVGNIATGSADITSVTSDAADHLLLFNHAGAGETVNIWRTSSVTEDPVLWYSFTNETSFPAGYNVKVTGDIDGDAQIVFTTEGIDGVSGSSFLIVVKVTGGTVESVTVVDVVASGLEWGSAPVLAPKVAPMGIDPAKGWMGSYYDPNIVTWVKADGTAGATMPTSNGSSWGWNPIFYDGKTFNNASYVVLLNVSHFPSWGMGPMLFLYDVTDPSQLTGEFTDAPALALSNMDIQWFQTGGYVPYSSTGSATGDVLIAPSADGFSMYIYYYDHHSQAFGAYSMNCIK